MNRRFTINNKFLVDPARNIVAFDGVEHKVEPRIIAVLAALCHGHGKVIDRKDLVEKIWNNYGSADEGLSQAISHIRKLLQDDTRQIIETVPKKGYIFHGNVTFEEDPAADPGYKPVERKSRRRILVALFAILSLSILFFWRSDEPPKSIRTEYDKLDTSIENYYNTVVTVTPDCVRHKLVVIGDQRPLLYINDSLLTPRQMEEHLLMVNILRKELQRRNKDRRD